MSGRNFVNTDELDRIAKLKGGALIAGAYRGSTTKLWFRCASGHEWAALASSILKGHWCRRCADKENEARWAAARIGYFNQLKDIALNNGGVVLSKEYRNAHTAMEFRCAVGHEWEAIPSNVLRGSWCEICGHARRGKASRRPIEHFREMATARGGKLLSNEYTSNKVKLSFECAAGHTFLLCADKLQSGGWCRECSYIERGARKRLPIEAAHEVARRREGRLISSTYEGNGQKMEWECAAGHRFFASYANVKGAADGKKGTWCPKCALARSDSESVCRLVIEDLSGFTFEPASPDWLQRRNPGKGRRELDGYCKELGLAFEHHGTQHYVEVSRFEVAGSDGEATLAKRKRVDRQKAAACRRNGVRLLVIRELFIRTTVSNLVIRVRKFLVAGGVVPIKGDEYLPDLDRVLGRDPLDKYRRLARERGGEILSYVYDGFKSSLAVRCGRGHDFETRASNLAQGNWCPECNRIESRARNLKYTIDDMRKVATDRGGKCLSDSYGSFTLKLRWLCAKGHEWEATPSNIVFSNKWCRTCAFARTAAKLRGKLDVYAEIAQTHGGRCLSGEEEYVNARTKLRWECASGHQFESTPDSIKSGRWCRECGKASRKRSRE